MSNIYGITGVGIDIVEIARIKDMAVKDTYQFKTYFTPAEKAACESAADIYSSYALIFAAKEAVIKALGVPGSSIEHRQIEIISNDRREYTAYLDRQWSANFMPGRRPEIVLTLNHCDNFAIAQATVYTKRILRGRIYKKSVISPSQKTILCAKQNKKSAPKSIPLARALSGRLP